MITLGLIKRNYQKVFSRSLIVSMVIHLVILFFVFNEDKDLFDKLGGEDKEQKIAIKLVPSSKHKKRQIVKTENAGKEVKNVDTKYLSEFDRQVKKQTVALGTGKFNKAGLGHKNGKDASRSSAQKSDVKREASKVKKNLAKLAALTQSQFEPIKQERSIDQIAKGLKTGSKDSIGLASTSDFIEEVPLGDLTQLNTKRYKYFSFYDRIRKKLENHWGRNIREKARSLFMRGGRLPASDNFITSLKIILDHEGNIVSVRVQDSSGIRELDEAAIDSFNKAGPFPNPPRELVKSGKAEIEWGFVVNS